MKKVFSLMVFFVSCLCSIGAETATTLNEAYHIYASADVNGQAGRSAQLYLGMKNRDAISQWQCTLVLPEGVTYSDVALVTDTGRYPDNYNANLSAQPNGNGTVTFTCFGSDGVTMAGRDGAVAVVTVDIAKTVAAGTYDVVVKDIILIDGEDNIHQYVGEKKFSWGIDEAVVEYYNVTFLLDEGGQAILQQEVEEGGTIPVPADPEREGYTFTGWSPAVPETMPAEDLTFVAQWQVNSYNLIYIVDNDEYARFTVEYGAEITPIDTPEKEGYTFSGWTELPETMPAGDVYVNGTFEVNYYGTEFYLEEGGDLYEGHEVAFGAALIVPEDPEKEGYTFTGWSPAIPETMPAENLTFVAQWQVNSYNLIYIVDNDEYARFSVEYGAEITPIADPEKEGYTFSGWTELPETMPAGDVYVSGSFEVNYYGTEFYLEEGGDLYEGHEVAFGAALIVPEAPEKEGYTFIGWEPEIPETMPAENLTFVAKWQVNSYDIIYIVDNDEYARFSVEYGAEITPIDAPEREGFEFSGWTDIPETMPAGDVYVHGTFTAVAEFITLTDRYATFSSSHSLDFTGSALKAYIATSFSAPLSLAILEEVEGIVPAGTGVLLIGEVGETFIIPYTDAAVSAPEGNLFQAVLKQAWINPTSDNGSALNYALDATDNLFKPLEGNGLELASHTAYLQLPASQVEEGKAVRVGILDKADGIRALLQNADSEAVYDLQGRRVSNAAKGIYIVGGKKVLF